MKNVLDLKEDLSERVRYNAADFPVYTSRSLLSYFPDYAATSHWHDDVELIVVLSGAMEYNVNGEIVSMQAGEGIFVNARQLHYGFSSTKSECDFICVLLHPLRLCSSLRLEQQYLMPLLSDGGIPYHHLRSDTAWGSQVLADVIAMHESRELEGAELLYQSLFYRIWWNLHTHLRPSRKGRPATNRRLASLKEMLAYIEANYQNHITLDEISAAGNMGRTTCCALFQKYVNQSPNIYLIHYRLSKGAELLLHTDMSVSEICYEVGFSGASYFAEMFRKRYGCSPSQYRTERGKKYEEKI